MKKALIICGPSGSGKGYAISELQRLGFPVALSVSSTTRNIRRGETDGVHYNFVSKLEFQEMIKRGEFVEWAEVHNGTFYGTTKKGLDEVINQGKTALLEIDAEGAQSILKRRSDLGIQFETIAILPAELSFPDGVYFDLQEKIIKGVPTDLFQIGILQRLTSRGTETKKEMQKRINTAKKEIIWLHSMEARQLGVKLVYNDKNFSEGIIPELLRVSEVLRDINPNPELDLWKSVRR